MGTTARHASFLPAGRPACRQTGLSRQTGVAECEPAVILARRTTVAARRGFSWWTCRELNPDAVLIGLGGLPGRPQSESRRGVEPRSPVMQTRGLYRLATGLCEGVTASMSS